LSFRLNSNISLLLIISLISGFAFSQNNVSVINSLQGDWNLCKYRTDTHYCESNSSRLDCNHQIRFVENQFILFKDSKKTDIGTFETEHHYDKVFFINFYSSSQDEILKLLGADAIKLINEKEKGFILLTKPTVNLYVLQKTQHNLEN